MSHFVHFLLFVFLLLLLLFFVINFVLFSSDAEDLHEDKEFANITLKDIVRVETLGMGGFGRVELVCPC